MRILTIIGLFLWLAGSLSGAQEGTKSRLDQEGAVRLTAELVELDVIVTDSKGRPVGDLQQTDFEVCEDGVKQEIVAFERLLETLEPMTEATQPPSQVRSGQDRERKDASVPINLAGPARYSLIYITVSDIDRAGMAARKEKLFTSLDELVSPSDRVAIALEGRLIQDFTSDRELLKEMFWKAISTSALNFWVAHGDPQARSESLQLRQDVGVASLNELIERQQAVIPDLGTEFAADARYWALVILKRYVRALGVLPGRKHLIWFNSGLVYSPQREVEAATIEKIISSANRGGVSFYIIDARGLVAISPGPIDQPSPRPSVLPDYVHRQHADFSASTFGSRVVANNTGGRFYGLNWPELGLKQVAVDAHNYYRLAYYPTNTNPDGKFRKITVKVKRPDVTVITRSGYLAPKPFDQMTAQERRDHLLQAMLSDKDYRALPVKAQAYVFPQPNGEAVVSIGVEGEGAAIPLKLVESRYRGQVDLIIQVLTESGQLADSVNQTVDLKLTDKTYRQLHAGVFRYRAEVKLKSGQYRLRVVARENEQGKLGSFEQRFSMPAVGDGLIMSDLVMSTPEQPDLPLVSRDFNKKRRVMVQFQAFNQSAGSTVGAPLLVTCEIVRGEQVVWRREETQANPAADRPITLTWRLPFERLNPGQYTLRVTVIDQRSQHHETRQTDFTVKT
jgi:VWFA-related protein